MALLKTMENPSTKQEANAKNASGIQKNEKSDTKHKVSSKGAVKKMKVVDYLKISLFPSLYPSVTQNEITKIGNTIFFINGRLLVPKENLLSGKLNWKYKFPYKWSTLPPRQKDIPPNGVVPTVSGVIGTFKEVETELAAFNIFVTESMLKKILDYTNEEIRISEYYTFPKKNCMYPATISELKAFIGMLYLFAVKKNDKISSSCFGSVCSNDIYDAVISKERFEYLSLCLRFDEYNTRQIRNERDPFTEIREIWDDFITKCPEVLQPSINCTIDEMFVDFNGHCNFKLVLPKQVNKHGIKFILLCDLNNQYVISGIPLLDKNRNGTAPLAEYLVEKLTKPIHGSKINVTYGNDWFNSIPLSTKMFNCYQIPTVGTLSKDQTEIPPDMILTENRPEGTSIFTYNIEDNLQLCTHCPKKGEIDIILSSVHFEPVINESGKPKVIEYYDSNKGGVDAIKEFRKEYSCSKETIHWFLAVFYALLDFASINSLTILNLNRSNSSKPPIRRVDFLYKLALDLMLPFIKERLVDPEIAGPVKNKIKSLMEERHKVNTIINPTKYSKLDIKRIYIDSQAVKPEQPVVLNLKPIQNRPTVLNEQAQVFRPTVPDVSLNKTAPEHQIRLFDEIRSLYAPIKTNNLIPPVLPNQFEQGDPTSMTTRSFQPDSQLSILHAESSNFVIHQIQSLYTPIDVTVPVQNQSTPHLLNNTNIPAYSHTPAMNQHSQSGNQIRPIVSTINTQQNLQHFQHTQPMNMYNGPPNAPRAITSSGLIQNQVPPYLSNNMNVSALTHAQSMYPTSHSINQMRPVVSTINPQQSIQYSHQTQFTNLPSQSAYIPQEIKSSVPNQNQIAPYVQNNMNVSALTHSEAICPSKQLVSQLRPEAAPFNPRHNLLYYQQTQSNLYSYPTLLPQMNNYSLTQHNVAPFLPNQMNVPPPTNTEANYLLNESINQNRPVPWFANMQPNFPNHLYMQNPNMSIQPSNSPRAIKSTVFIQKQVAPHLPDKPNVPGITHTRVVYPHSESVNQIRPIVSSVNTQQNLQNFLPNQPNNLSFRPANPPRAIKSTVLGYKQDKPFVPNNMNISALTHTEPKYPPSQPVNQIQQVASTITNQQNLPKCQQTQSKNVNNPSATLPRAIKSSGVIQKQAEPCLTNNMNEPAQTNTEVLIPPNQSDEQIQPKESTLDSQQNLQKSQLTRSTNLSCQPTNPPKVLKSILKGPKTETSKLTEPKKQAKIQPCNPSTSATTSIIPVRLLVNSSENESNAAQEPSTSNTSAENASGTQKDLSTCGVCDSIGEKKTFVECYRCTVTLCTVHRKVMCTHCFISIQTPPNDDDTIELKKAKCDICVSQGLIVYSLECSNCDKFLCMWHSRMLCCFCADL